MDMTWPTRNRLMIALGIVISLTQLLEAQTGYQKFCEQFPTIATAKGVEYQPAIPGVRSERVDLRNSMFRGRLIALLGLGGGCIALSKLRKDMSDAKLYGSVILLFAAYDFYKGYTPLTLDDEGLFEGQTCILKWCDVSYIRQVQYYGDYHGTELIFMNKKNEEIWKCDNQRPLPISLDQFASLITYFRNKS
jgi:hypothetical protein